MTGCAKHDANDASDGGTLPDQGGPLTAEDGCYEPNQLAVNWSADPVADNKIFTRGFSIYVVVDSSDGDSWTNPRTPDPDSIRLAFGTALTDWTSSLLRIRDSLDPPSKVGRRHFLLRRCDIACSRRPGNCTSLPSKCALRRSLGARSQRLLPVERAESYVAKAAVEGRAGRRECR